MAQRLLLREARGRLLLLEEEGVVAQGDGGDLRAQPTVLHLQARRQRVRVVHRAELHPQLLNLFLESGSDVQQIVALTVGALDLLGGSEAAGVREDLGDARERTARALVDGNIDCIRDGRRDAWRRSERQLCERSAGDERKRIIPGAPCASR